MNESYAVETVDIVFDGPPSHESGRFVECEDRNRKGVCLGEWFERDDGFWVLRIKAVVRRRTP